MKHGVRALLCPALAVAVTLASSGVTEAAGAVVLNGKGGIWIVAGGPPSEMSKLALDRCEDSHAGTCKVQETFGAGCFSVAIGIGGAGYAIAGTYGAAQEQAMAKCARTGKSCSVRTAQCNYN